MKAKNIVLLLLVVAVGYYVVKELIGSSGSSTVEDCEIRDVVERVEDGNTFLLGQGITVHVLGIKEDKRTDNILKRTIIGKEVRVVFDSNSGTLNDSRNEVWGYVNVIEDNGEYSLTQKLLQNAFSELNLEHVHDSLDAFVNYASVDEGQTLSSEDIHAKIASAAFLIYSPSGESIGTGFFIGNNGLAVSNSHVVGNDSGCQIYLFGSDGSLNRSIYYTFKKIVFNGANENLDLVIFYVDLDGNESNYIPLSRRDPVVGMKAFAFGNPRGLMGTFSAGQVSALREDIYMIQIDTPITNGNSGGPVVNDKGHAIGVSAAGIEGGGNLNFAVDTRIVRMILSELGIEIPKK